MKVYPSWRYHKNGEGKIIHSEDQEHPEWKHSPADHEEKQELEKESSEKSEDGEEADQPEEKEVVSPSKVLIKSKKKVK